MYFIRSINGDQLTSLTLVNRVTRKSKDQCALTLTGGENVIYDGTVEDFAKMKDFVNIDETVKPAFIADVDGDLHNVALVESLVVDTEGIVDLLPHSGGVFATGKGLDFFRSHLTVVGENDYV